MPTPREFEDKFWSALKSDRTMMLGLDGVEDGHARPMTAQVEGEKGPIWFFTARDHAIVEKLELGDRAIATFASKGHDLFATLHGSVSLDTDRAVIDRLWNRFVAAWYEGEGRSQAGVAALRCGTGGDLAGRVKPRGWYQNVARRRSQGGLQGQGRGGDPSKLVVTDPGQHVSRRAKRSRWN